MRPSLHLLRIYGPKNGLIMDEQQQTVIQLRGASYKSYLQQFIPPWSYARQYAGNAISNVAKFIKADFQAGYGMKVLIDKFYQSVTEGCPVPIPYQEILRTTEIMDKIFGQLHSSPTEAYADGRTVCHNAAQ
jgi:hypothetical protein